jgi:predicted regulator of Ras-like GTPase activity (Roadblock/LC7/MglB family)
MVQEASLSHMTEPSAALAQLTDISTQIEAAVLFDADGKVVAATIPEERAVQVATSAKALLEQAGQIGDGKLTQVEASTANGSLFVVTDGSTMIAASTSAEPTAGLVFYDLKIALREAAKSAAKPKTKPRAAAKPKPKPKPKPKRTTPPRSDEDS